MKLYSFFFKELQDHVRSTPCSDYSIPSDMTPDVWFEPTFVWEILGADLSISPRYTAAMGRVVKGKGISLRFPRFIRSRPDKKCEEATSAESIAQLYRNQGLGGTVEEDDEEDEDAL